MELSREEAIPRARKGMETGKGGKFATATSAARHRCSALLGEVERAKMASLRLVSTACYLHLSTNSASGSALPLSLLLSLLLHQHHSHRKASLVTSIDNQTSMGCFQSSARVSTWLFACAR